MFLRRFLKTVAFIEYTYVLWKVSFWVGFKTYRFFQQWRNH